MFLVPLLPLFRTFLGLALPTMIVVATCLILASASRAKFRHVYLAEMYNESGRWSVLLVLSFTVTIQVNNLGTLLR
jgi:hypothetical protein